MDILRQALYREASVWRRSMALIETGCQEEPLALTTKLWLHHSKFCSISQEFSRPQEASPYSDFQDGRRGGICYSQSLLTKCLSRKLNSSLMTLVQSSKQDPAAWAPGPWLPSPHSSRAPASLSLRRNSSHSSCSSLS